MFESLKRTDSQESLVQELDYTWFCTTCLSLCTSGRVGESILTLKKISYINNVIPDKTSQNILTNINCNLIGDIAVMGISFVAP